MYASFMKMYGSRDGGWGDGLTRQCRITFTIVLVVPRFVHDIKLSGLKTIRSVPIRNQTITLI